jgi:hypothetical protein
MNLSKLNRDINLQLKQQENKKKTRQKNASEI